MQGTYCYDSYCEGIRKAERGEFQDALNIFNEVFLFHPEGATAYKYYFRALVEPNPEDRMRELERAREGFLFLFKSVNKNMDKGTMNQIHNRMIDHYKGLEGSQQSTLEEYNRETEQGLVDFAEMSASTPE